MSNELSDKRIAFLVANTGGEPVLAGAGEEQRAGHERPRHVDTFDVEVAVGAPKPPTTPGAETR